jgi:hypothetical protein
MTRGTGQTTTQMKAAPIGALYVWCNHHTGYPRHLAQDLGRGDLQIVTPEWIFQGNWRGCDFSGKIVDHALDLSPGERDRFMNLFNSIRVK